MRPELYHFYLIFIALILFVNISFAENLEMGIGLHGGYASLVTKDEIKDYKHKYSTGVSFHFKISDNAHFVLNVLTSSFYKEENYLVLNTYPETTKKTYTNIEFSPSVRLFTSPATNNFNFFFIVGLGFITVKDKEEIENPVLGKSYCHNGFYTAAEFLAGFGVQYAVHKNINLEIMPLYHFFDSNPYPKSKLGFATVNLGLIAVF